MDVFSWKGEESVKMCKRLICLLMICLTLLGETVCVTASETENTAVPETTSPTARAVQTEVRPTEPAAEYPGNEDPEYFSHTEPAQTSPTTEPTAPAATVPKETAPEETKSEETVPEETAPDETVPEETVPEETVPEETEEQVQEMPQFFQEDYPDTMYVGGTVASSGCNITSLAMVASYMTGHYYSPAELAESFGGFMGSQTERLEYASTQLRLPWRRAGNWPDAREALKNGDILILLMNAASDFTSNQHFIVVYGITPDGKLLIRDSSKVNHTRWELKDKFENGFEYVDVTKGYDGGWIYEMSRMPEDPYIYVKPELDKSNPRYPDIQMTGEEKELLARMVWVEAQGETYDGQQAIAEIVLNRVAADNFPNNINDVIMQEGQFRSAAFLEKAKPTQTQYEAIERAIYGPYVLPEDVVFFATSAVNSKVWGSIGGHVFCHQW